MRIRFVITAVMLLLIFTLTGCSEKEESTPYQFDRASYSAEAVIEIAEYGTVKVGLLKEAAPAACESFIEKAENGFFDGMPVYNVISGYCVLAGDGESKELFYETGAQAGKAKPFYGALCASGTVASGYLADSFMLIGSTGDDLENVEELLAYKGYTFEQYLDKGYGAKMDDTELGLYKQYGGAPWLKEHCVVFGQMTEGSEVLGAVLAAETAGGNYTPTHEIIIESVTIVR